MPELLTLQDLANGHLDVKALGEAANGDENTIVTTRTGNTYPSAERAINIMFQNGGLPAKPFQTKAEMQTDGASLADGQLAMVYNETANNGLYVKTAGAWVKPSYDKADIASPSFLGTPTTPTPSRDSKDLTIANTKFVSDAIGYGDAAYTNVNLASYDEDTYVLSESQFSRNYINIYGTPKREVTIIAPSDPKKQLWIGNRIGGNYNLLLKTDTQTAAAKVLPKGLFHVISTGSNITITMDNKADVVSPELLGNPTAPTPSPTSYDKSIATTIFVRRMAQGVADFAVTNSSTEINELKAGVIALTGTLTKDIVLTLPVSESSFVFINQTVGGYSVTLKGSQQNSPATYVDITNGTAVNVFNTNGVVRPIPFTNSGGLSSPATSSSLGVVKIGAGINVTSDGTISASAQAPASFSYAGKFKEGANYEVGDIVEHGSGIYRVESAVTNVKTPLDNPVFNKIQHNYQAGDNKSVTVISNTREIIDTEFKKPYSMSRSGLVCFNNGTSNLKISRDWGVTWSGLPVFSPPAGSWLRWTRELENGELMICVSQTDASNPIKTQIYKSRDWDELAGTATSWDIVHEFQRNDVYIAGWGFSQYGNIILLAEYGGKNYVASGGAQDAYPRYCYLSKDNGETWSTVFDLADYTDGVGVHLHGVCFDEYWNRIWISHGDGSTGKNGLYYSDDLGKTWVSALQTQNQGPNFSQSVGIVALPTCILFSSDSYPNGVQRIDRAQGRIPYKGYYEVESAYRIEPQQEVLNHILSTPQKAHWLPNAPYIWTWAAESRAGNSGCVLTWDGWNFHTVWKSDTDFDPSRGAKAVIGITPENTLIVVGDETVDATKVDWKRTIKVSFD